MSGETARFPLPPGSTIGVLGGGQLGRMLAMAAARLGLKTHIYSDEWSSACEVTNRATVRPFEDLSAIAAFAEAVDVVTFEFENVPLAAAAAAERICPVRPGPRALAIAQDRLEEKRFLAALDIPVPRYAAVNGPEDFQAAVKAAGLPAILKTRRLGYDGKGQVRIAAGSELPDAFAAIGSAPAILEAVVGFAYELSVLVVRAEDGQTAYYDIPVNVHGGGILRRSGVPAPLSASEEEAARAIAAKIVNELGYIGVLAVEMFYVPGGGAALLVNEFAPRVHNSGHWTLDACVVSQFENHIRAVAGWPLGPTWRHSDAEMVNLIGDEVCRWGELAGEPGVALHVYGKGEARPGRKMGHYNRLTRPSERCR